MPATWITERPSPRRLPRSEAPRLELPLPQPAFERAQPTDPEGGLEDAAGKRGTVIVDFYI